MNEHNILGAILAGGKSKRMGKDKLFLNINDKPIIEYTINKVKKYLEKVIIVTNHENTYFPGEESEQVEALMKCIKNIIIQNDYLIT